MGNNKNNEDVVAKLDGWSKAIIGVISVMTIVVSIIGGAMVQKALTDYRMTALEKQYQELKDISTRQEQFGNPGHERRITKLEGRADEFSSKLDTLSQKVEVGNAILIRIEAQVNSLSRASNSSTK